MENKKTKEVKMNSNEAINNLRILSTTLNKCAGDQTNSEWSTYLEQMSFEMHKYANELNQISDILGVSIL
jgi:hypothetical protein